MEHVFETLTLAELGERMQRFHPYVFCHGGERIKYFSLPLRTGRATPQEYLFLVCRGREPVKEKRLYSTEYGGSVEVYENFMPVYGVLELQVSPYAANEIWLKYLSVHPHMQGQGIARRLAQLAVDRLKDTSCHLSRSTPSLEGSIKVKKMLDRLLDEGGIPWSQTG